MITCNLDRERGLCNGTRATVLHATRRLVTVRILSGRPAGQTVDIPRITQTLDSSKTKVPFSLLRRQFRFSKCIGWHLWSEQRATRRPLASARSPR